MPFKIIRNDITKMHVDAIVNTANEEPVYASGTDAAVYEAAGAEKLLAARRRIGVLKEGEAAITPGFLLPAKYIIHAASPRYHDGRQGEADKLRSCYEKSLELAKANRCRSIAFPLISTGSFGFPREEGMEIALRVIQNFLLREKMTVYLVVFDRESMRLSGQIFDTVEAYIDEHYVEQRIRTEYDLCAARVMCAPDVKERTRGVSVKLPKLQSRSLQNLVDNVGETFQQRLLRLISEKGMTTVEAYKGANKDKKFFYKISSNVHYQPTRHTVYAFAISLRLSLDETKDLLASAGLAMSPGSRFDIIMQYVLEQGLYDFYKIDCILYDFAEDENFFCCEKD